MLTRIKKLPTPALVISVIALCVAVGGGAFAVASSDSHSDKKIAKKVVKKLAPKLSVKRAKTANAAYTGFDGNGATATASIGTAIDTLAIPKAGSYVITATLSASQIDSNNATLECKLVAGSNSDDEDIIIPASSGSHEQAMALQTQHTFDAPGSVSLHCTDNGAINSTINMNAIRIAAVQVDSLTSTDMSQ